MEVVSYNNYAGFTKRFFAFIIDQICIVLIIIMLVLLFHVAGFVFAIFSFHFIPLLFTRPLYYVICETSKWQGTIGKRMFDMRVINERYKTLTIGEAIVRYLSKIISGLFFCIGYIWIIFDPKKQGWHDKLAHTYVIEI